MISDKDQRNFFGKNQENLNISFDTSLPSL